MKTHNIESVKIALQNARDNARALRLSGAPESVQNEAYELVYQLRTLLDDVTLAQNVKADSVTVTTWAYMTIVWVRGFNFELKQDECGYVVINDNGMTNTSSAIVSYLNNL